MKKVFGIFLAFLFLPLFIHAQEVITITTYYPSPSGVYRELRTSRMTIGDNYSQSTYCWPPDACINQISAAADLVVEGNVGIGTYNPMVELHVGAINGNADIATEANGYRWTMSTETGGNWVLNHNIPGDLPTIVADQNGRVGIRNTAPQAAFDISGDAMIVPRAAANPSTSINGMIYYNTTDNQFKAYEAGTWKTLGPKVLQMAKLARSTAQSIPSSGTHKIFLNYEEFDDGGIANPATGSFVIGQTGLYEITASWRCGAFSQSQTAGADSEMSVYIYVNGAEALHAGSTIKGPVNESGYVVGSDIFSLNKNDVVEMYVQHTAGSARDTMLGYSDRPRMSVVQLR